MDDEYLDTAVEWLASAWYSGGSGFKSRPETGHPDISRGFPQYLQANTGIVP
jgi:hypothetical protein